jgi:hypothetical protein
VLAVNARGMLLIDPKTNSLLQEYVVRARMRVCVGVASCISHIPLQVCLRCLRVTRARASRALRARYSYRDLPGWGHADGAFVMQIHLDGSPPGTGIERFFVTKQVRRRAREGVVRVREAAVRRAGVRD